MSDYDWKGIIESARNGNGQQGRWLLWMASRHLEENWQWPEELRMYMAEILNAAADAPTSSKRPNAVSDVLNVTLPPGVAPKREKIHDAVDVGSYRLKACKHAKYYGGSRQAAFVKVVAEKFNISEKTALRRIKYLDDMDAKSGMKRPDWFDD